MNSNSEYSQGYLDSAPIGIDARFCWTFNGGQGEGKVKFIDIEQGWLLDHEKLSVELLSSTGINAKSSCDHGAAVLGVIMMNGGENGLFGITPRVEGRVISTWRHSDQLDIPDAVFDATKYLSFGDILLLTIQRFQSADNLKALPVEIHQGVFDAIRYASDSGIIVIESAGNGEFDLKAGVDLDGFECNGKTIFNQSSTDFMDSGAIIVSAATASIPHQRISYSNYGSRVDCYAWGEKVVTLGNYPKSSGTSLNKLTNKFCGTSSAAAIIAGAAISVQSICEANLNYRLSPKQMREILSDELLGTPSENGSEIDRIGVMPDLKKIITKQLNKNNEGC